MDPNENLQPQLRVATTIQKIWDDCNEDGTLTVDQSDEVSNQAAELAELVLAMHGWISKGGFLPRAWNT